MLSQAVRRLRRPTVALPAPAVGSLGTVLRRARVADFSPEQLAFLTYGRGVDTTRMRTVLGFEPAYTTAEAFADFGRSLPPTGGHTDRVLGAVQEQLERGAARPLPAPPASVVPHPAGRRPAGPTNGAEHG